MLSRLGSALILIGLVPMVIFLVTYSSGQGQQEWLLLGAGLSALGLLFRRRQPPAADSGRFRTLRRLMGESFEENE